MEEKCCSRCGEIKLFGLFIKNRNICKECDNKIHRENYAKRTYEQPIKCCNTCNIEKDIELFINNRNICKDCNNLKRTTRYHGDEKLRQKISQQSSIYKHDKVLKRQEAKREKQLAIGEDNQQCPYCDVIFNKSNFRHNRQKCKDCERKDGRAFIKTAIFKERLKTRYETDPIFRFLRLQRTRICNALKSRKTNHTIEYLGCTANEFYDWMYYQFDEKFTFENHGTVWHIDHVIPIAQFNLDNVDEQFLCLNWRNTMPLSVHENLSKNKNIVQSQIAQHYQTLLLYHKEFEIEFPEEIHDMLSLHGGNVLNMQHDQIAGNPLES